MNENEMVQDDEISLFDLWEKLQDGWRHIVGGAAIGLLGAGVGIAVIPPKYEAIAVVQVGQVGQVVEPATQAIERMKMPAFQLAVAKALGHQAWANDLMLSAAATGKYVSLQSLKGTATQGASSLIELKATAGSSDEARKVADGMIAELARRHAEIAKPMLDKLRLDLSITKEKLVSAEKELEGINKLVANVGVKDDRFTQLSLMTSLRVQKEAEVFGQRQMIMSLETALMPPATQPAKAIEEVFVQDKAVSPKKGLMLALGLVGGLLAGVMSVFLVGAWRRAKEVRAENTVA